MKLITGFNINADDFPAQSTTKDYTVQGDNDAVFSLKVQRSSDGYWYDFVSDSYTATETSRNRLANKKIQGSFSSSLSFPPIGAEYGVSNDETYTIYLFAEPHFDTKIDGSLSVDPVLYTTILKQLVDTTITFYPGSSTDSKYSVYGSSVTSTGSPLQTGTTVVDIDWNIKGAVTTGNSFGLTLIDQPANEDWFSKLQTYADGAISSSTSLVVDSVDRLSVGMVLFSATGLSGTPAITSIDKETRTITLSFAQSLDDNVELVFYAYGSTQLKISHGIGFTTQDFTSGLTDSNYVYYEGGTKATESYHTVRAAPSSSTTVTISPTTLGISKFATVRGINFVNSGNNAIQSVTEDETGAGDGAIVMQIAQVSSLAVGTKLYIDGSSLYANVKGKIYISSYPTVNLGVVLNLDRILTPGTGS